ncbi:MAG: hypothetical protein K8R91_02085 [Phycisphaerae bacterium]|nr:hypothetical protein [Phycisphaerae bacterium]
MYIQAKMRLWGVLLIFAAGLCGCKFSAQAGDSAQPLSPSVQAARNERITQLEDELHMRDKQIEELRSRDDLLSGQAKRLEFLNEQLQKQLKAVGDAPRQRDRYKQQAAENQLEIDRLRSQIKELKLAIGVPTSKPAPGLD